MRILRACFSGLASNGGDFEHVPEVIAMPAGATNLLVPILPFDDNLVEGDENVLLELVLAPELSYAIEHGWAEMRRDALWRKTAKENCLANQSEQW